MDRDQLTALFAEKKNTYPDLLDWAKREAKSEQWAMGSVGPFSLEPYSCEVMGITPGKILKAPSKPAKNRHRYLLDQDLNVIRASAFNFQVDQSNEWSHSDEFFFRSPDHILGFGFNSVPESATSARLQRLTYARTETGKVLKTFSLNRVDEYVETDYEYKDDKVVSIKQRMWYEVLFERNFVLKHDGDHITILERFADGSFRQIYPAT